MNSIIRGQYFDFRPKRNFQSEKCFSKERKAKRERMQLLVIDLQVFFVNEEVVRVTISTSFYLRRHQLLKTFVLSPSIKSHLST